MKTKFLPFIMGMLCAFLSFTTSTFATHLTGGTMTYRCLGNNQYEVSVKVYRDCDTGIPWFDDPISLGIFDAQTNSYIRSESMFLSGINDTVSNAYPDTCLLPSICIHSTVYRDTLTLPFTPSGYILVYQRCCRSNLVSNIVDSANEGFSLMVELTPAAMTSCNSTPTFDNEISLQIGQNVPLSIDGSATDIDGDSLVYELYAPFSGADATNPVPMPPSNPPYASVIYLPPYTFSNPLSGTLNYDANTGILSGTAPNLGYYILGLSVKEYNSNGDLLSVIYRDLRVFVSVAPCDPVVVNVKPIFDDNKILLYPNPADNSLTVELEENAKAVKAVLYTTAGQELWSNSFVEQTTINMAAYPKGIYVLKLITEEVYIIKKVVKE